MKLVEARRVAEAAGEAKSAILAAMSHENRTPMNGMVCSLHMLQRSARTDQLGEMVKRWLPADDSSIPVSFGQVHFEEVDVLEAELGHFRLGRLGAGVRGGR